MYWHNMLRAHLFNFVDEIFWRWLSWLGNSCKTFLMWKKILYHFTSHSLFLHAMDKWPGAWSTCTLKKLSKSIIRHPLKACCRHQYFIEIPTDNRIPSIDVAFIPPPPHWMKETLQMNLAFLTLMCKTSRVKGRAFQESGKNCWMKVTFLSFSLSKLKNLKVATDHK